MSYRSETMIMTMRMPIMITIMISLQVPLGDYELPLGKADVISEGTDVTVVAWGAQVRRTD